jgi:hypothetical protein
MGSLLILGVIFGSSMIIGATLGALKGYDDSEKIKLSLADTALLIGIFSVGGVLAGIILGPCLICTSPLVVPILLYKRYTKKNEDKRD